MILNLVLAFLVLSRSQIKSYYIILKSSLFTAENFSSVVEMYRTGEFHIPDSSNCKYERLKEVQGTLPYKIEME